MWKLFLHKEKNSIAINIVYILAIVVYVYSITSFTAQEDMFLRFYGFFMFCVMPETFRHSIFNLSYYFANDSEVTLSKPIFSRLKTHLQLLSIKMDDFIMYNVIYTFLRLIPFLIITLILGKDHSSIYTLVFLSLLFLLKAFVGPMTTYINSLQMNVYLNDKELSRKEKNEIFFEKMKDLYPRLHLKTYKPIRTLYTLSVTVLMISIYLFIFRVVFKISNDYLIIGYVLIGVSMINIFLYGLYVNLLERNQDRVLYQE